MLLGKDDCSIPNKKMPHEQPTPANFLLQRMTVSEAEAVSPPTKPRRGLVCSHTTLFVRNLPFDCTNSELEAFFSEFGPLKGCFVVANHQQDQDGPASQQRTRGIGFVHFALAEDAKCTLERINSSSKVVFKGRELKADWATAVQNGAPVKPDVAAMQASRPRKPVDPERLAEMECRELLLTLRVEAQGSALSCDLSTNAFLCKVLKQKLTRYGMVEKMVCESFVASSNEALVRVNYRDVKNSVWAYRRLLGRLKVCVLESHATGDQPSKKKTRLDILPKLILLSVQAVLPEPVKNHRLIIRNLPFSITRATQLTEYLSMYGEILEITLPEPLPNPQARYAREAQRGRGFAFVQYKKKEDAERALNALNGTIIKNRTVAVDWSVPKMVYEELKKHEAATVDVQADPAFAVDLEADEREAGESEVDADADAEGSGSDVDIEVDSEVDIENCSEAELESSENKTVFIKNMSFDTDEEALEAFMQKHWGHTEYAKIVRNSETGASKGTAFVCFKRSSVAKSLVEASEAAMQSQGPNATLVDLAERRRKRPTNMFKSLVNDPDAVVQVFDENGNNKTAQLGLDGRQLQAMWAVDRSAAASLAKRRSLNQIDAQLPMSENIRAEMLEKLFLKEGVAAGAVPRLQRNLLLIKESLMSEGDQTVAEEERAARESVVLSRARLAAKNANLTVSLNRLAVHHLPGRVDQARLKEVLYTGMRRAREMALQPENPLQLSGKMLEAVRALSSLPKSSLGMHGLKLILHRSKTERSRDSRAPPTSVSSDIKSRGYGFVEWKQPLQALLCVRYFRAPQNWQSSDISEMITSRARALKRERGTEGGADAGETDSTVTYPVIEFATEKETALKKKSNHSSRDRKQVKSPSSSSAKPKTNTKPKPKPKTNTKTNTKKKTSSPVKSAKTIRKKRT